MQLYNRIVSSDTKTNIPGFSDPCGRCGEIGLRVGSLRLLGLLSEPLIEKTIVALRDFLDI
jgi:hypothetical protein